ncbi:MAG TPA: zf-HC2 domain-containing protein [Acidisarcina sp.]
MAERNANDPKGAKDPANPAGSLDAGAVRILPCEEWESLLADSLDGTLAPAGQAAFDGHTAGCHACTELLARSKQGQEWLQFLAQPAVSPDLVAKILARTSGAVAASGPLQLGPLPQPAGVQLWMRAGAPMRLAAQPRLMMTAAMAFFSIALTLNLAGVRLNAVRAADLRPSVLRTNLTRQFVNSRVGVQNHIYNLRIFYEMEARARELKRSSDAESAAPAQQETPAPSPKGSAGKSGGKSEAPGSGVPRAALWGTEVDATLLPLPAGRGLNHLPSTQADLKPQPGCSSGNQWKSYVRPDKDPTEGSLA